MFYPCSVLFFIFLKSSSTHKSLYSLAASRILFKFPCLLSEEGLILFLVAVMTFLAYLNVLKSFLVDAGRSMKIKYKKTQKYRLTQYKAKKVVFWLAFPHHVFSLIKSTWMSEFVRCIWKTISDIEIWNYNTESDYNFIQRKGPTWQSRKSFWVNQPGTADRKNSEIKEFIMLQDEASDEKNLVCCAKLESVKDWTCCC